MEKICWSLAKITKTRFASILEIEQKWLPQFFEKIMKNILSKKIISSMIGIQLNKLSNDIQLIWKFEVVAEISVLKMNCGDSPLMVRRFTSTFFELAKNDLFGFSKKSRKLFDRKKKFLLQLMRNCTSLKTNYSLFQNLT